jgi:hypothetical protein
MLILIGNVIQLKKKTIFIAHRSLFSPNVVLSTCIATEGWMIKNKKKIYKTDKEICMKQNK